MTVHPQQWFLRPTTTSEDRQSTEKEQEPSKVEHQVVAIKSQQLVAPKVPVVLVAIHQDLRKDPLYPEVLVVA